MTFGAFVIVLLLLGGIVFAHELGHFAGARLCNMAVSHFTVGFGPRWATLHWQRGETEYRIAPILAGGECRIVGMRDNAEANAKTLSGLEKEGRTPDAMARLSKPSRFYASGSPGKKFVVSSFGPLFSIIAAYPLLVIGLHSAGEVSDLTRPPVVDIVFTNGPAVDAGFVAGDVVLSVDERPTGTQLEYHLVLLESRAAESVVEVLRGEEHLELRIAPDRSNQITSLGFSLSQTAIPVHGWAGAFREAGGQAVVFFRLQIRVMVDLFAGRLSADDLAGPVGIVKMGATVAKASFAGLIVFFAIITLALGVTNMLPIPCLDGGHVLFACIEAASRRSIPDRIKHRLEIVGACFLLVIITLITLQDLGLIRLSRVFS